MSHIKTILFLVTALAVGIGIGKGYLYWKQHNSHDFTHVGEKPLVTGVGEAPEARGFVLNDVSHLSNVMDATDKAFGTTIGIEYAPGMTREALVEATKAIHGKGMQVVLLPQPVFTAANPYGKELTQVAADGRDAGVDFICISWANERTDAGYWLGQAKAMREVYKGKLIFAATPGVLTGIECWDACDILGAIGPLSIPRRLPSDSEDVSEQDLRVAWDCVLSGLESLGKAHDKRVALLRVNIPVRVAARISEAPDSALPPNPKLQRLIYDALLLETKGRAARTAMMLFSWGASGQDAPNNMPNMLHRIGEAWESKEPKGTRPAPVTAPGEGVSQAETAGNV